jgi:hypothetical protein
MAVVSCKLKPGSRRGPVRNSDGGRSYYETYIVRTNSALDDGRVVEGANGLPPMGQQYPEDAGAVVTERDPQQIDDHDYVWEVYVAYTSPPAGQYPGTGAVISVEDRVPLHYWTSRTYRVFPTEDLDGKPFTNSAGDFYDPPPPMLKHNRVLTILLSALTHNEAIADAYLDSTNTDAFTVDGKTYPKFSALITRWDAQEQYLTQGDENIQYFDLAIDLEMNKDLWHPFKEIDRGPRARDTGKEGLFLPKDAAGVTYHGEIILNGKGFPRPDSESFRDKFWYREWKVKQQRPFGPLRLPFLNQPAG